jgi:hypothetical protein
MRGRLARPQADDERSCCRRLLMGVILQAVTDARQGNDEAGDWLTIVGPTFAELLGLDSEAFAAWETLHIPKFSLHRTPKGPGGRDLDGQQAERRRIAGRDRKRRKAEAKRAAKLAEAVE